MGVRIVVAEDDEKQAELVRRYLVREGHEVAVAHDGLAAIERVHSIGADLVVLDVMLPGADGYEVCSALRETSDVLVLMLTARATEDDLLRGLDLGADDYMTKPFSPRELAARVRTLLRRSARTSASRPLRVGALAVDSERHEVTDAERPVHCTPGEFRLLEAFAGAPGHVFTRSRLLELLHGTDRYITARTVDVHIMNLRKKLEPDPRSPSRLLTVYGIGYKLAAGA